MLDTTQLKEYAQLTQATYAYFATLDYQNSGGLKAQLIKESGSATKGANFTDKEATLFTERYELLNQSDNADPSGFSGALFRDMDTGRLILSFRGTEPFGIQIVNDLLVADARIGVDGYASPQAISLYRYIKQLTTPQGQPVQYTAEELAGLKAVHLDQADSPLDLATRNLTWTTVQAGIVADLGAGLIPAGCPNLDFVGHSLGGHLAMLASRFFPDLAAQVVTLNAPNFFSSSEPVFQLFSPGWSNSSILRMEAAGDGISEIGTIYPGTRILLGQENESGLLALFAPISVNHDKVNSADGLALVELIGKLDSRFAADARLAKLYIDHASELPGQSYEKLLDGLRRVFLGKDVTPTTFNDGTKPSSRDSLYTNISALAEDAIFNVLAGKVTLSLPGSDIATSARNDFSAFLAVLNLSTFVLKPTVGNESEVVDKLKTNWTTEYSDWQVDKALTPDQRANGEATYSDEYLTDRAAFLTWKLKLATEDFKTTDGAYTKANVDAFFSDIGSNLQINLGSNWTNPADKPRYIFGADQSRGTEAVSGGSKSDRMYGGGGDDVLYGHDGHDHLEGNAGSDILTGGAGQDTLLGGQGNDLLEGGKDNDLLKGGQGTDTYKYSSGDGWDTLEDSDGQGRIQYDGIVLKGGKPIGDSGKIWQEEAGGKTFTYILTDWSEGGETFKRLSIQGPDGGLFVKRWQAGNLGIALPGATPPASGDILLGDKQPLEEAGSIQYDVWGNIIPAGDAPGRQDTLYDTPGDDTLRALAGDDLLDARRGGRNILEGGEGRDRLFAGTGNDELHADARLTTDEALALNTTQASSGEQGDLLTSGGGDDTLIGGAGNDAQFGGEGRDFIVGGGGDDDIYGDDNCSTAARTWSIGRSVSGNLHIRGYSPDMAVGTAPGSADVLYGGKGEDWIMAGEGNDRVDGGDDNDVLWGDAGADTVLGGNGNDSLSGDSLNIPVFLHGNDLLEGGAGDDELFGQGGTDILYGGEGNDTLSGDFSDTYTDASTDPAAGADTLNGGAGNDRLNGGGNDDQLYGDDGNDDLVGDNAATGAQYHGKDRLWGGAGNDTLDGAGNDDVLFGGEGDDLLFGDDADTPDEVLGNDQLFGNEGNDFLLGDAGNDLLDGGEGDDQLFGDADNRLGSVHGADSLYGGSGNDELYGGGGNDSLEGGEGNDLLHGDRAELERLYRGDDSLSGGDGNDAYLYEFGDGRDIVFDSAGDDEIRLGDGIGENGAAARRDDEGRIVLTFADGGSLRIDGGIERVRFSGGAVFSPEELLARAAAPGITVTSGSANATLYGERGDDTFVAGGAANQTLQGWLGNDIYEVAHGSGAVRIVDSDGGNVVRFGAGITRESIVVRHIPTGSGTNTVIEYGDAGDTLTLQDAIYGGIDRFVFDGGETLAWDQLVRASGALVIDGHAGDNFIVGSDVGDRLAGGAGTDRIEGRGGNDLLSGGEGNDTLLGGSGNDTLAGGAGDDTYVLMPGDGADSIDDTAGRNIVEFGAGIEADDVTVGLSVRNDGRVWMDIAAGSDSLSVKDGAFSSVSEYRFSGGVTLSAEEMMARLGGSVRLFGDAGDNTVLGTSFDDFLDGGEGSDLIVGGAGNDELLGGAGDDTLRGGDGDDHLCGDGGNNFLAGGAGNDAYHLAPGSGHQIIAESGPGQSLLQLDAGVGIWSLVTRRQGDDLRITIGEGARGVTISGYYAEGREHAWQIRDSGGDTRTLEEFVSEATPLPGDGAQSVMAAWREEFVSRYYADLLGRGYARGDNGSWLRSQSSGTRYSQTSYEYVHTGVGIEDLTSDAAEIFVAGLRESFRSMGSDRYTEATHQATGVFSLDMGGASDGGGFYARLGSRVPMGSMKVAVTDANGALLGHMVYPPGTSLAGGSVAPASVTYTTYRYEQSAFITHMHAGAGDNNVLAGNGSIVDAGDGNDRITSWSGYIAGDSIGRLLFGGKGNDTILGGNGSDIIIGGEGDDLLDGGVGADIYVLDGEPGEDRVFDHGDILPVWNEVGSAWIVPDSATEIDTLVFPESVAVADLSFAWEEVLESMPDEEYERFSNGLRNIPLLASQSVMKALRISWGAERSVLVVMPHDDAPGAGIERFRFHDGTVLTREALLALAPTVDLNPHLSDNVITGNGAIQGFAGDDTITGGNEADAIFGGNGNDSIRGEQGDDMLSGGRGSDSLHGGEGYDVLGFGGAEFWGQGNIYQGGAGDDRLLGSFAADVYEYNLGDGEDIVSDAFHSTSTNDYGGDYFDLVSPPSDADAYWDEVGAPRGFFYARDRWTPPDEILAGQQTLPYLGLDTLRFGDGIDAANVRTMRSGNDFQFLVRGGGSVTFENWFGVNEQPLAEVQFADGTSWEASSFGDHLNAAPTLADVAPSKFMARAGRAFSVALAGTVFVDGDGDALRFAAFDGASTGSVWEEHRHYYGMGREVTVYSALPSWLTVDPETGVLSGIVPDDLVGQQVQVIAVALDAFGARTPAMITLEIGTAASQPVALDLVDQLASEDQAFVFALPADAFVDPDVEDYLTLMAKQANGDPLPGWLSFDAVTRTFSGTPGNTEVGSLALRVTATDGDGLSASSDFNIFVANVNDAPVVANVISSQMATEGVAFHLVVPADAFADMDAGDTLVLSATLADGGPLPVWLNFDAATGSFTGTPVFADTGDIDLKLTATDAASSSVSQIFKLVIDAVTGVALVGTPDNDALTGTHRNDTLDGGVGRDRMAGGAGDDIYFVDNTGDAVVERAGEGKDTVISLVNLRLAADVENLTLAGAAHLSGTGNVLDNVLAGNTGNNALNGGLGVDRMAGGAGNDTYTVDNVGDVVTELAGEGSDRVISSLSYTLGENVENLTLSGAEAIDGTGNALDNTIVGNAAPNALSGLGGNDRLTGGDSDDTLAGGAGNDTLNGGLGVDAMIGGTGNDTYYVDDAGDAVTELADEGTDRVVSTIGYTLGDHLENLTLSGTVAIDGTGNALNNSLTGNAAANTLIGEGGNDTLNGGLGSDAMVGGIGNDTYYVDNAGDAVTELADEGTDRVISTIGYTLGDNLENLTLSGTAAIDGTGNALNNSLTGNAAINLLAGGAGNDTLNGGLGADAMVGGIGNDTYYVDDAGDVVTELADEGTDRVVSTIGYTLGNNLENLTLSGTAAIDGTGNALNNSLTGNAATNLLAGGVGNDTLNGGLGADAMVGGTGNGTYYVDDAGDAVSELADEGTDRVVSTIGYTLGEHLENLTLSGTAAIDGTGNALNNSLTGNAATNLLNGGDGNDSANGGAGLDFLEGAGGNDTLTDTAGNGYFNGGSGADRLTGGAAADFFLGGAGNDTIATGAGNDLIAFNKGDGYDAITLGAGSKTISLGGGIAYSDLRLRKSGNDLVLDTAGGEGMALRNWYVGTTNQNVLNLQIVAEAMAAFDVAASDPLLNQKVQDFDFKGLAGAFDAARATNPGLTSWALTDALAQFHLSSSDSAALGGDLAYQYGKNGTLAGVGLTAAQEVIGDANFGSQAQALRPLAGLQDGAVRLS
ncbi:MAG: putative Ig domain-containing protein [Betaproteobacteria bacterium]|nr:putative Ig domain-containing protein [Betaproteobacteria bacterium]